MLSRALHKHPHRFVGMCEPCDEGSVVAELQDAVGKELRSAYFEVAWPAVKLSCGVRLCHDDSVVLTVVPCAAVVLSAVVQVGSPRVHLKIIAKISLMEMMYL